MSVNKAIEIRHEDGEDKLVSANLNYLMRREGIDVADLNKKTGIAASTINALRRGVGNPTLSTLVALAEIFDITVAELVGMDLSIKANKTTMAFEMPIIKMSEVSTFTEGQLLTYETYTTEIDTAHSKRYFAITMSNDSLAPHFGIGTVFIICRDEIAEDGDIVLVKIGGHYPCLRKIFIDGDSYSFSPIVMNKEDNLNLYDKFEIIGIVIKSIKTFSEK
jgi:SOS-response transcriptional repressor LexA